MEQPFSNREILEKFNDIKETLGRIEAQTTKTNGRVNLLETERAERSGRNKILTAIWGLSLTVLISYLSWVGIKINEVQAQNIELKAQIPGLITEAVSQAILPYAK